MKFKELQSMSENELQDKMKELKMDLIKANAQVATGTIPKNPGQVKQAKKAIAKIKSILNTAAPVKEESKAKPTKETTMEEKKE